MNISTNEWSTARCGRIFLIATSFSNPWSPVSVALNSSAIPPTASRSTIWYLPTVLGMGPFTTRSLYIVGPAATLTASPSVLRQRWQNAHAGPRRPWVLTTVTVVTCAALAAHAGTAIVASDHVLPGPSPPQQAAGADVRSRPRPERPQLL